MTGIKDLAEGAAEDASWKAYIQGPYAHHVTDAFRTGWIAGRDWHAHNAAQDLQAARARIAELSVTLDAMTEAKNGLLRQRDQYMDRFGLLLPWLTEHVKEHDSDVVDIDHGPIVEWDYCDWCEDHGLPSDWPCVFARAANPTLDAALAAEPAVVAEDGAGETTNLERLMALLQNNLEMTVRGLSKLDVVNQIRHEVGLGPMPLQTPTPPPERETGGAEDGAG